MRVAADKIECCCLKKSILNLSIANLIFFDYTTLMPVTKTAKRALRSSKRKESINKRVLALLDSALKNAKKSKLNKDILSATSLADKAAKRNVIHKNKASRIKSRLSKIAE
jgi:small subunit ribosomal protein S20